MHVYEVRPRKDRRGFDLISDVLPFGRRSVWAVANYQALDTTVHRLLYD
jgi:hypothetical protein